MRRERFDATIAFAVGLALSTTALTAIDRSAVAQAAPASRTHGQEPDDTADQAQLVELAACGGSSISIAATFDVGGDYHRVRMPRRAGHPARHHLGGAPLDLPAGSCRVEVLAEPDVTFDVVTIRPEETTRVLAAADHLGG